MLIFSLNPRVRIQQHVEYLAKHITITDEIDKQNYDHVYENFCILATKLRAYQWAYYIVSLLLYISVVAAITRAVIPGLAWALEPFIAISGVIGFGVLSLIWVVLSSIIHAVTFDLMSEHSHLVALLIKHNDEFIAHPSFRLGVIKEYNEE